MRCFLDSFQSLRFSVPTANNETRRPRFRSEAKVMGGGEGVLKDFGGITWFPGGTEGDQSVLTEYKGKRD